MFGQIPDFNDGLEFLRKMWGNAAGMPGMAPGLMPGLQAMTPPLSLEDVDKRIHDLKAVESWLQLNTNLLRTTIQGLEVQRATLVALKTFGNALSPEAMQSAMENVARAANAPSPARRPSGQPAAGAEGIDARDIADMAEMEATPDDESDEAFDEAPDAPTDAPPDAAADEPAEPVSGRQSAGAAQPPGGLPPQAGLWWDMVQRQFNQIASGAAAASLASLNNLGAFGPGAVPGGNAGAASQAAGPAGGDAANAGRAGASQGGATGAQGGSDPSGTAKRSPRPAAKAGARSGAKAGTKAGATAGTTAADADAPAARARRTRSAPKT